MSQLQPLLETQRLRLRPLREEDFEELFEAASDPLIWEQHTHSDRWQKVPFRKYFDSGLQSEGALVIIDKSTDQLIGCSRYYDFRPEEERVTLGFTFITRKYWGGGYNAEIKEVMLAHAFSFVKAAYFEVATTNFRSRRALEKLGALHVKSQGEAAARKEIYRFTSPISSPS